MDTLTAKPEIIAALGTPNYLNETRSDFNDLTARMPKRYVSLTDHTRIVKGATDLVHPNAGRGGVGRSVPDMGGHAVKAEDDTTHAPRDLRSERQIEVMTSLVNQLGELDMETGLKAMEYTVKMTEAGRWTAGRGGNASVWIGRMIAKVRELKAAQVVVHNRPENRGGLGDVATVPDGYYAVADSGPDDIKFYRVKNGSGQWAGRVFIDAQASDDFHKIRNVARIRAILATINTVGVEASMALYGQHIGRCGRCHRTLTDADSRAYGIGPDCREKL